jgi:hypothetical protein
MQEQTDEAQDANICLSRQEVLFKKMLAAIDHSEAIGRLTHATTQHEKRINSLEVANTDTKEAVESLRTFFLNQNLTIVDSVGDLKKSVDAVIAHVTPMVNREEKLKAFVLKWSLPTIFILLSVIFFGGYAATLGQFVKAVIG